MSKPVIISVTDFIKNFGTYQRRCSQGTPVFVMRHANIAGVFISDTQFQEYEILKKNQQQLYQAEKSLG